MTISTNYYSTLSTYMTAGTAESKLHLSDEQKKNIQDVLKNTTEKMTNEYAQASSLAALGSNPYNPFYGVSQPINPYNYSSNPSGVNQQTTQHHLNSNFHKNMATRTSHLDNRQNAALEKFNFLRSTL